MRFTNDISDTKLIEYLHSDKYSMSAFETIFFRYSEKVYAYVLSISKEVFVAEEVTQQVFIRLWEKRSIVSSAHSLSPLLFTMSYNAMIDVYRQRSSNDNKTSNWWSDQTRNEDDPTEFKVEFNNLREIIEKALMSLPEKRQIVFRLAKEHGFKYKEIAEILGISVKTVENQMNAALKTIRKILDTYEITR